MDISFEKRTDGQSTTTWITPLRIVLGFGDFDLDPCTPPTMPWDTAKRRYTEADNGLVQPWEGRVWLNPPYDNQKLWLKRLVENNNGIALIPARMETRPIHELVFAYAHAVFFKKGRIQFLNEQGELPRDEKGRPKSGNGVGSLFAAYGEHNANVLEATTMEGRFVRLIH